MAVSEVAPIVSARRADPGARSIEGYLADGGYEGLRAALARPPGEVVDEVKAAQLLGRGGAGFPAGQKWGFLPPGKQPYYLVVNGDESEPGTCKDRVILENDPHLLVEGTLICAYAIGAAQAFIYIRGEMALAQERVIAAVEEAYQRGFAGRDICGSGFSVDVVVHWGAGAYIVGEETALLESLEGKRGMPRLKPPYFPAAIGLYGQPTVVNNVETLANLPWVLRHGADAFLALGTERAHGTRLFAVSGHVRKPGVFEVEYGTTTFRDVIFDDRYAGGIRDGNQLKAFIPGGSSAPWLFPEHLDLALDPSVVGPAGSMLGSGAIVVMDETTDAVRAALRLVRFYAHESCGKCTPCREGTTWLATILSRVVRGGGRADDLDLLLDVADNISPPPFPRAGWADQAIAPVPFPYRRTTICDLGPSVVSPLRSAIERFRPEFEAYLARAVAADGEGDDPAAIPVAVSR